MDDGSSSKMSIEVRRYILLFAIICTGNITKSEELADECRNVEGLRIWELFWNVFVRDVMVYCELVYIVGFLGGSIKLRYLNRNFQMEKLRAHQDRIAEFFTSIMHNSFLCITSPTQNLISLIFIIMRSSITKKQSLGKQKNSLAASCSLPETTKSTLNVQQLLQVFSSHYLLVEECFRSIQAKLTLLQSKLASCFGNFNQVEWKLSREALSIRQARSLNESLILMNSEIEAKLAGVKADYEDFRKRKYVSVMEQRVTELKEAVHGLEIENYRNKFSKHQKQEMEDNLDRLEELAVDRREKGQSEEKIYAKVVEDLVRLLKGEGDVGQWVEQKVRENIRLKTQLIRQTS